MSRIEKGLHEHHARLAEQAQTPGATQHAALSAPPTALEAPFAKVNSVVAGSPADVAGLRVGDTMTKFGWVDWTNHERLSRVAEAVAQNEGVGRLYDFQGLADAHRFRLRSRCCDRPQAARRRRCRCSSRRGATGADGACWAAICCRCDG
jgi:hypothetical protein